MVIPRLLIAAPASGQGKTTVATGLMAALTARGVAVAPFKTGPDYIDPGYHSLATGRPGRNLDAFLCGEELLAPLLLHGSAGADVALIEGAMGLFDGRLGTDGFASSAHVARLVSAPVLLVVDTRHTSRSIGAVVAGMAAFDPRIRIAGVILNHVGSQRHEAEARAAIEGLGVEVVGAMPRNAEIVAPSRHLGLVPAAERSDAGIAAIGEFVSSHVDLDRVLALAASAGPLDAEPWRPAAVVSAPSAQRPRVAIAGGRAFTFRYPETDELLVAAGCEPVVFDPLTDRLPEGTCGLWLGGGFPEMHALELAANEALLGEIRAAVASGMPTVAECAGYLYLGSALDGVPMVGALETSAAMGKRLTLGYREAEAPVDNLLADAGTRVSAHEFHRTQVTGAGDRPAWQFDDRVDGVARGNVHASYLHVHWAGHPVLAQKFANAVHAYAKASGSFDTGSGPAQPKGFDTALRAYSTQVDTALRAYSTSKEERETPPPSWLSSERSSRIETQESSSVETEPDLLHHGDQDLRPGLIDFAVNVRRPRPPQWLLDEIQDVELGPYPDARAARAAIANYHGVPEDAVLPTSGAAEAFTLIARAIPGDALVVHPQFTEPEAALRAAGRTVARHVLPHPFRLAADQVPAAEVIIVGNPTNPTGVLHPRAELLQLKARVLVVDEAFLDTVPGEPESLIGDLEDKLVLRSLTKTWALAGLRAGYVVGDPKLIALLEAQQPPWSVSTPALAAMVACLRPEAAAEAAALAQAGQAERQNLMDELRAIGLDPVLGSAPFVLVDTSFISGKSLREPLAERGFAVRRGETFPGLGPTWLRLAARSPELNRALAQALANLKEKQ